MIRPAGGRIIAGVCAGIADAFVVDVSLVRLAFLLLGLASGIGVVIYLLLWLLTPSEEDPPERFGWVDVVVHNAQRLASEASGLPDSLRSVWRHSEEPARTWPRPLDRRWIAIGLIAGGGVVLIWSLGLFRWLSGTRVVGLVAVAAGLAILVNLSRARGERRE